MSLRFTLMRMLYALRRVGWPGWAGISLVLVLVVYAFVDAWPSVRYAHELEVQRAILAKLLSQDVSIPKDVPRSPVQKLLSYYEKFPESGTIPGTLTQINELAAQLQLTLDIGEYEVVRIADSPIDRMRITFPVKGKYVPVRKFVSEVLLNHPNLSLESLSVRRGKVADDLLDCRIVFVLFTVPKT